MAADTARAPDAAGARFTGQERGSARHPDRTYDVRRSRILRPVSIETCAEALSNEGDSSTCIDGDHDGTNSRMEPLMQ